MPLHAELHRHLGGAIVPRIFWRYLHRSGHPLAALYPEYEAFEAFVTRPRASLTEFLELHTLFEQAQRIDALPYFITKLVRGAFVFEGIVYLELRHTPYYRTDAELSVTERIRQMREVVETIAVSAVSADYPLRLRQILCMHSRLPLEVNRAILDLAAAMPEAVCGVDLAGPDTLYRERLPELIGLFQYARAAGLPTTCHLFETQNGVYPELLPFVNRIGHGIHIALEYPELLPQIADRGQCLEVCPTSYLRTGTLQSLDVLRLLFARCESAGVDVAICTDNPGLHDVRLPFEYENLLTRDIINFTQLRKCQDAAFRHAFDWPLAQSPDTLLHTFAAPQQTARIAVAPRTFARSGSL